MYVALKIDKIEFYLCVEKQAGCTCMEGEKGSGTDISKHPISGSVLKNGEEMQSNSQGTDHNTPTWF